MTIQQKNQPILIFDEDTFKQDVQLGTFKSISSDGHCIESIVPTGTFFELQLEALDSSGAGLSQSTIDTEISYIEVKINNNLYWEGTPKRFREIMQFNKEHDGWTAQDGYINIPLIPSFKEPNGSEQYGVGMQGVTSFTIKVKYGTITNLATLNLRASKNDKSKLFGAPLGVYTILNASQNKSNTGKVEYDNLPRSKADMLGIAYHIELSGSAAITSHSFRNGTKQFKQEVSATLNKINNNKVGKKDQSGMYSVFLAGNNTIGQAMPLSVKEPYLEVNVATAALGSHNIVMERVMKAPAAAYTTRVAKK